MFSKLKQFNDLRHQAHDLQRLLGAERVTVERQGVTVVVDGNQQVISLSIPPELGPATLEQMLPGMFNDATAKVQQLIAQKMQRGEISLPQF
ncbi:MAG: hypothetical protein A2951_00930 [Candidatus Buchananbacteria bacterium RIFCSPLOWO2_01_FULL_56_15]|uniref:Nucleoid-associated protein, YbaB/EbfC family n=2 Tax=Candidatus Buchananiibacteriota TaxID=1817903 RepID=A0A1G1YCK8_9BACT|nr:MAG: hypothetical protein A3J59_01555 [Candidatus Buchananbacteria bacterium RIFCSPHIGHO2_02_FULL_56_16]OGY55387.1 MAG: hypothetical protein A2951_00930 [Candidatus Buchananbacteria bacterium RIFCSPLOWO2_01_FULL_56_15]